MIKKAMILAAGRGERLRPITDSIPKPLVEVGGVPLIVHHINKLSNSGIKDIVINTAWLGEKLVEVLGDGSSYGVSIAWSHEMPGGLETAGGLRKALPLLGSDPFLVVNGDTYIDADYSAFRVDESWNLAVHMWLTENPPHHPHGDFSLNGGMIASSPAYTFTGIAVYSPDYIAEIPEERCALKPWFENWIKRDLISGELLRGTWFDVGTVQRLEEVNAFFEKNRQFKIEQ
jgi:MurNAc alpha-1-phosphate uridylyltransferase